MFSNRKNSNAAVRYIYCSGNDEWTRKSAKSRTYKIFRLFLNHDYIYVPIKLHVFDIKFVFPHKRCYEMNDSI